MASRRELAGMPSGRVLRGLVLELLREVGRPLHRREIGPLVADRLDLTAEQRAVMEPAKGGGDSTKSFVDWVSEWACNDLKHVGVCEQPARAHYQLTEAGWTVTNDEVGRRITERRRAYNEERKRRLQGSRPEPAASSDEDDEEALRSWKDELLDILHDLPPQAFEELCGQLLQAAGFQDVEVTGRSGDGGIDGIGTYRPADLISFHTAFQCKRYQGSVSASAVRDFRGSFIGRSERGIIMTTGAFTNSAKEEAARPGANVVDLVDGDSFCRLLLKHEIGVQEQRRTVIDVIVDPVFFQRFEELP